MAHVRGVSSVAWALTLLPVAASAAEGPRARLAVLPDVMTRAGTSTSASDVFRVVERAARAYPDLEVVPYDEVLSDGADSLTTRARACASDLGCLSDALGRGGVALGLRVIANVAIEPALVSLSLVPSDGRPALERLAEVEGTEHLDAVVEREVFALLDRAGLVRGGRVSVRVSPPDALVEVRGREGATPGDFVVPAGRWTITAHHAEHTSKSVEVDVAPGGEVSVELVLEPRAEVSSSPWLWAAIGVAAAAAATSVVLIAADPFDDGGPRASCLCITTSSGACPPCP